MRRIEAVFSGLSSAAVGILMVLITLQVVARYFFHPVTGTVEFAQAMMVVVVYLGLAGAFREGQHIGVDFVLERVQTDWVLRTVRLVGLILCLLVGIVWTWQATKAAYVAWEIGDTTGGLRPVPLWPSRSVIFLGSALLTIRVGIEAIGLIRGASDSGQSMRTS